MFQSPCGEKVLKVDAWIKSHEGRDAFQFPCGEKVLKVWTSVNSLNKRHLVSVPLRGKGFESLYINMIQVSLLMKLFQSPCGEKVLKGLSEFRLNNI